MNDKSIRPLLRILLADHHLIEELPTGDTRIDMVAIGSDETWLNGYEIKSKSDTLKLLPNQILQYEQVCLGNYLVAYENHIAVASKILPDRWGLYVVREVQGQPKIQQIRDALPNHNLNKTAMLKLLWGDELRAELRKRDIKPRTMTCSQMIKVLEPLETPLFLSKIVTQTLKSRGDWMERNRQERARIHQSRRLRAWVYGDSHKRIREGTPPDDWVAPFEIREKEERRISSKASRELNKALRANGLR